VSMYAVGLPFRGSSRDASIWATNSLAIGL
jgi:hypothetical protein